MSALTPQRYALGRAFAMVRDRPLAFLLGVALMMVIESVTRLISPQTIHYREAIAVATLGLTINLLCALILGKAHHHDHHGHHGHHHGHGHEHAHAHDHGHEQHEDLNLKSAYLHVLTDAATSVLAILALVGGWLQGWSWMDPVMGLVGAIVVALWAKGLLKETATVLLDREMDHPVVQEIREVIEDLGTGSQTHLTDLHVWRVGSGQYACLLSLEAGLAQADALRERLSVHEELVHISIEHRPA